MQKKILALAVILTTFIFSTTVFAAYTRVADNTVPAYTNAALNRRNGNERVDKGDRVTVHQETGNAYRVTYPTRTGSKTRWVPKSIFNAAPTPQPVGRYKTIPDGWYKISSMKAPYRVLDVAGAATNAGANIQLWDWANVNQQKFKVTNLGNGYFTLTAGNCGLNISAANDSRQFRTNVQLASPNSNDAKQQWRLVTTGQDGNKIFYIESRLQEKLALDCQDTGNSNGTNIWLWEYGNVDWNKWKFESVSAPPQNVITTPMKNWYCTWRSHSNWSWGDYDYKESRRGRYWHLGLDVYGDNGFVYAMANGTVEYCSNSNNGGGANGRYIVIRHNINGQTFYSFYAHLASIKVSKGQSVSAGEHIGVAGGSGSGRDNLYKTHLHFAIVNVAKPGNYLGYTTQFTGDKVTCGDVTFYNPRYVISNGRLP